MDSARWTEGHPTTNQCQECRHRLGCYTQEIPVDQAGAVAHQTTGVDILTLCIDRGKSVTRRQRHQLILAEQNRVPANDQRVGLLTFKRCEGRIDLAPSTGVRNLDLQPERAPDDLHVTYLGGSGLIGRVRQHRNSGRIRRELVEKLQPLSSKV